MSIFVPNNAGTVTFTHGSKVITGTSTLFRSYRAGSVISIPGVGSMQLASDPTSDTAAEGVVDWQGSTIGPVEFQYLPRNEEGVFTDKLTSLLNQIGNGNIQALAGLTLAANKVLGASGPGALKLIDRTEFVDGVHFDARVADQAGLSLYAGKPGPTEDVAGFTVLVGDWGDGRTALVSKLSDTIGDWSEPGFVTGPQGIQGIQGEKGDAYQTDATVEDMDGLTAYDSEEEGFRVFVRDLGAGFDNRSGVVVKAASVWGVVALYTGPKGSKGDKGNRGWSPMFAGVADGERRVEVLIGYVGGGGTPPTDHVGEYRKGDGTYTTNIAEAVDYRGPPGANGAGTVAGLVDGDGIAIDATDPTHPEVSVVAFTGDSGAGGALGGVPAPAAGDAADGKVLGAGGGWVKPATVPRGHLFGLVLANNATDATNDIDIAPGEAASDDTAPVLMALASGLTKRLDATWAVGDGEGGRDAGSIADGVWYVWLIQRSDTGVIDALFSLSKTAPTTPSGYDRKRRIGCIIRASAQIKAFKQTGDRFDLTPAIPDGVSVPLSTTQQSLNVSLPPEMIGLFRVRLSPAAGAGINLIISGLSISANANEASLTANGTAGAVAEEFAVPVTSSGQILHRCAGTVGASNMVLTSYGWIDDRGRNV